MSTLHPRTEAGLLNIDSEFCKRIERAEAIGWRSAIEHGLQAFPDRGLVLTDIAGAPVCYAGPDSPFTQSVALGIERSVRDEDVEAIIAFYQAHNSAARVVTSPVAGDELSRMLIRHGFTVEEYENVLAGDLTRIEGKRDRRIDVCALPDAWAEHSGRAFEDGGEPSEALRFISMLIATHSSVAALALYEDGEIVATGCLGTECRDIASFFGTSTSPSARGRGYQTALIRDRIARAQESGATIARATAKPGTASERNFRRAGFQVLYTRTTWVRPLAGQ